MATHMPRSTGTWSATIVGLQVALLLGALKTCMAQQSEIFLMKFEAFTVYSLHLFDNATRSDVFDCPTAVVNPAAEVTNESRLQLDCTWVNSAVPVGTTNDALWSDTWALAGSCTGFQPAGYFSMITEMYNKYNPNVVLKDSGLAPGGVIPPSIDRDVLLGALSTAYGKRAWIECDRDNKNLQTVVVCLARSSPHEAVDCPFSPTQVSGNGLNCAGQLNLPTATSSPPATKTPTQCEPYIKSVSPAPVPPPPPPPPPPTNPPAPAPILTSPEPAPPPDESSGSSVPVGAIVGGILGGLALVAAVVIGIALARRKRRGDEEATGGAPFAAANGVAAAAGGATARSVSSASFPSTPVPDVAALSWSRASSALASDPLMQYINSTLPRSSSRGSLESWELLFEDITVERPIGEGSWGRVYKGTYHQTQVAVKVLLDSGGGGTGTQSSLVSTKGGVMARLEQEAMIMSSLHHPNIVHLLGVCIYPAAIVTEFCARGSLTAVLQAARASPERAAELTWSRRISMAADCCRGMLYLHSRRPPIIHRDLKSANLLVTASWKLKVSDFNLSKIMEDSTRSTSMQAMNPRWLAPEVLEGSAATLASDVFAMGVIFWEMLTWELPWGIANPWTIVGQINAGNRLPVPAPAQLPGPDSGNWPKLGAYLALMERCWTTNPEDRPNFEQIMAELRALDPAAVEADV